MNLTRMTDQLWFHEGFRSKPYRDTVGKLTVGVGYNLDDRGLTPMTVALGRAITMAYLNDIGLTEAEGRTVLQADIRLFEQSVRKRFPMYDRLTEVRQRVVLDLAFNVGTAKALGFVSAISAMTAALQQTDPRIAQFCYDACCFHLMDSLWANQVDDGLGGKYGRADRLCRMMRTGEDYVK
jgi:lysozyme